MKKNKLKPAMDFVYELADEETKAKFEYDDILYTISNRIFNYRRIHNLTQKELAKKLYTTRNMISKFESCEYNFSINQLWRISKALGWGFAFMFAIDVDENENSQTLK